MPDKVMKIVDVIRVGGAVLIRFSNGGEALYQAQFLWDVRMQDGNIALSEDTSSQGLPPARNY